MKLRRRVPDYTTPDWVHSLQERAGPRFGEKPLKTTENLGLGLRIRFSAAVLVSGASFPVQGI
jgi:hypothetical protein